jgi:broad specificity phosphatase PhoE
MILIRHGQSEFNVHFSRTGIDPGIVDPHLTATGREQVRQAAEAIQRAGRPIARVLTSPYTRALQTAEIVADLLKVPVDVEPLVREHAKFQCDVGTCRSALSQSWPALKFDHLEETWWPAWTKPRRRLPARPLLRERAAAWATGARSRWSATGASLPLDRPLAANAEHLPFDPMV